MNKFILVTFSSKTGKVKITLEGISCGLLKLYAFNNTKANQITIIYAEDTEEIMGWYEGKARDLPIIDNIMVGMTLTEAGVEKIVTE